MRVRTLSPLSKHSLGKVILESSFGIGGQALQLQQSGFSDPEEGFTWSEGCVSTLQIALEVSSGEFFLILKGTPFLDEKQVTRQEFRVLIDSVIVGTYSVECGFTIALPMPASRDGQVIWSVRFDYASPISPSALGGDDRRLLCIAWQELAILRPHRSFCDPVLAMFKGSEERSFVDSPNVLADLARQIAEIRDSVDFEGLVPELIRRVGFFHVRACRLAAGDASINNNRVSCFLSAASLWTLHWPVSAIKRDVDQYTRQRLILRFLLFLPALEAFACKEAYSTLVVLEISSKADICDDGRPTNLTSISSVGTVLRIPAFPEWNGIQPTDVDDYSQSLLSRLNRVFLSCHFRTPSSEPGKLTVSALGDLEIGKMLTESRYSTDNLCPGIYGFEVGSLFVTTTRAYQRLRFSTHGQLIGEAEANATCLVEVPLALRGNIEMELPDRARPVDLGLNGDKRTLGIGLVGVRLLREASVAAPVRVLERRTDQLIRETCLSKSNLARFVESIGDDCELGMVQREYGEEPLSLFRFAETKIDLVADVFEKEFAGFSTDGSLKLSFFGDSSEYFAVDEKYGFNFHTWVFRGEMDETALLAREYGRLNFLGRKLLSAARHPTKVFVFRDHKAVSEDAILRLARALRTLNSHNRLLIVKDSADAASGARLERVLEDLWLGWVDYPSPEWWATADSWVELLIELALAFRSH